MRTFLVDVLRNPVIMKGKLQNEPKEGFS